MALCGASESSHDDRPGVEGGNGVSVRSSPVPASGLVIVFLVIAISIPAGGVDEEFGS